MAFVPLDGVFWESKRDLANSWGRATRPPNFQVYARTLPSHPGVGKWKSGRFTPPKSTPPPYTRQLGWEGCNMTYTTRPWSSSNNGRSRIKQGVGPDPCVEGCLTFFPLEMRTFHPEAQKVPEFQGARSTAGAKRRRMASKQVATRAAMVSSTWTLSCLKGDHPDCSFGQDGVPRNDSFKQGT